ncbi:hypothetical protein IH992_34310 [Candidatus Poribacteria bacterium]|nr:hypothetical protein [Candidatus Poribacteria bacterium]
MAKVRRKRPTTKCKSKSRFGNSLIKRRRKGSDGKMRTVCVMTVADKKRARKSK